MLPRLAQRVVDDNVHRLIAGPSLTGKRDERQRRVVGLISGDRHILKDSRTELGGCRTPSVATLRCRSEWTVLGNREFEGVRDRAALVYVNCARGDRCAFSVGHRKIYLAFTHPTCT